MKVLVSTPEFLDVPGGIATFYQNLVKALVSAGAEVCVITGSAVALGEGAGRTIPGVRVEGIEPERFRRLHGAFSHLSFAPGAQAHLAAAWAAAEQVAFGAGFDVIEAADWGLLSVPFVLRGAAPTVVQCHGSIGQIALHDPIAGDEPNAALAKMIELAVFDRAQVVQTYSMGNARFWERELNRPIEVIRPAFAPTESAVEAPRDRDRAGPERRATVFGRLQGWKGPEILCEALRRLGARAPVIDWYGRDMPWGQKGVRASDFLHEAYPDIVGGVLRHHPSLPREKVGEVQARSWLNIIPSTWDVFNFTVVEAMMSGRPTLVSNGAGASELVEDGVTGFVFPAGDAGGLAAALEGILGLDDATLSRIGRQGRMAALAALDPGKIGAQRLESYSRAIAAWQCAGQSPGRSRFLDDVITPRNGEISDRLEFLHGFPARKIARHLGGRLRAKVGL